MNTLGHHRDELRELKCNLFEDVGLIALDDLDWYPLVGSGIAALAQPTAEIGASAFECLLKRLRGDVGPVRILDFSARLIVRASTLGNYRLAALAHWVLPGLSEGRLLTGFEDPADIAAFYLDLGAEAGDGFAVGMISALLEKPCCASGRKSRLAPGRKSSREADFRQSDSLRGGWPR